MGRPIEAQAYDHEIQRRGISPHLRPPASIYSLRVPARRLRSAVTLVICLRGYHALWSITRRLATWPVVTTALPGARRRPAQTLATCYLATHGPTNHVYCDASPASVGRSPFFHQSLEQRRLRPKMRQLLLRGEQTTHAYSQAVVC